MGKIISNKKIIEITPEEIVNLINENTSNLEYDIAGIESREIIESISYNEEEKRFEAIIEQV